MLGGRPEVMIFCMLCLSCLPGDIYQAPEQEVENRRVSLPIKHLNLSQVARFVFDLEPQDMTLKMRRSKRSLVDARDVRRQCWPSLYDMLEELKQRLDIQIELRRSLYPFRPSGQ